MLLSVFKDWGTARETCETTVLRLDTAQEKVPVATIHVGGADEKAALRAVLGREDERGGAGPPRPPPALNLAASEARASHGVYDEIARPEAQPDAPPPPPARS